MPSIISFLIVVIVPTILGIYYSFTDWNGTTKTFNFVGLDNYIRLFTTDQQFINSFWFTLKFTIVSVISINIVGFALALLVTAGFKGSNILRSIFFMPNLIGGIMLGFIWQFIFREVFKTMGNAMSIPGLTGWLSDTQTSFWGLVIVVVWQLSGYMMIIYIAQIQNISDSVIEASKIDGANPLNRLINITMPLVAPAFTIGLFLSLSNAFKLYDQNVSLTGGAPGNTTEMLALNIYTTAFTQGKLAMAQSKALIFMLAVAVITVTQLAISRRREVEM